MANFTDDDDALLAELGIEIEAKKLSSRTPREERIIAGFEDIQRFVDKHGYVPRHDEERDIFKPLFERVQADLKAGTRSTRSFVKDAGCSKAEIAVGQFFILGGQTLYVAEVGEPLKAPNGESDARLRVIFEWYRE